MTLSVVKTSLNVNNNKETGNNEIMINDKQNKHYNSNNFSI